MPSLPQRAGASIREYLENREAASARVSRTGEVGGEPPRGFAEIRWESRFRGMSEMVTRTLFVAFVYEDGAWRVAELRVSSADAALTSSHPIWWRDDEPGSDHAQSDQR